MAKPKSNSQHLARLPGVDELLHEPLLLDLEEKIGRPPILLAARDMLARLREEFKNGVDEQEWNGTLEKLPELVAEEANKLLAPSLRTVINATGVVLHTNLGRAPLSQAAANAVAGLSTGYTNLEFNLETGKRGQPRRANEADAGEDVPR